MISCSSRVLAILLHRWASVAAATSLGSTGSNTGNNHGTPLPRDSCVQIEHEATIAYERAQAPLFASVGHLHELRPTTLNTRLCSP